MTSGKSDKSDGEQFFLLLNETQKLVVQVRPSSIVNNSIDIIAINNDEADRPDPLRVPEVIIVICVLLLWCASIFIFIRHSQLLRIRHRDLPFRSSMKPPMNLNRITVVHRTSDMVIHSKPRVSSHLGAISTGYNRKINEYKHSGRKSPTNIYISRDEQHTLSVDSNSSASKNPYHDDQLLDPYMISSNVRRSLLDLHKRSMINLSSMRYSMSYSTNDISRRKQSDDQHLMVDERCIQESPL